MSPEEQMKKLLPGCKSWLMVDENNTVEQYIKNKWESWDDFYTVGLVIYIKLNKIPGYKKAITAWYHHVHDNRQYLQKVIDELRRLDDDYIKAIACKFIPIYEQEHEYCMPEEFIKYYWNDATNELRGQMIEYLEEYPFDGCEKYKEQWNDFLERYRGMPYSF